MNLKTIQDALNRDEMRQITGGSGLNSCIDCSSSSCPNGGTCIHYTGDCSHTACGCGYYCC